MPQVAPQPDTSTGEPRPPHAPVNVTAKTRGRTNLQRARVPSAPSGEGPILEFYQETNSDSIKTGLVMSLLVFLFLCLKDWGFDWMSTWWLWIFVFMSVPFFYFRGRTDGFCVGADWFATSKKTYVKLYELKSVEVTNPPGLQAWGLELHDRHGGFAGVGIREVQQNQALWDLVYNGIAYSVLKGPATANQRAREMLRLGV